MKLNERLRNLIEERDLTQKQLAKDLNIAASTLGGYVQGYSEPDFETLKLLASYFHVSTDYLLGYQTDMQSPLTEREIELLQVFRALSDNEQEIYLEQGKSILKVSNKKKEKSSTLTSRSKSNII